MYERQREAWVCRKDCLGVVCNWKGSWVGRNFIFIIMAWMWDNPCPGLDHAEGGGKFFIMGAKHARKKAGKKQDAEGYDAKRTRRGDRDLNLS